MSAVAVVLWHGLRDSLLMAWEVWWALVLGFAISACVQAFVPRGRVEQSLGGGGARPVALAGLLGAASSSCSYGAVALARTLFARGASAAAAIAFEIASTNIVWELGLVLWVLIGWQFAAAEYAGGAVMIVLVALAVRVALPARLEASARRRAAAAETAHHDHDHPGGGGARWRTRAGWAAVATAFRADLRMLYKEIAAGLLLAGYVAQLGNGVFGTLFVRHAPEPWRAIENVIAGPLVAVASFVCSVGNVPLAAVLWSGGISFAGVLAFLFADLIVLPIVVIYRKYYGLEFALRLTALLFVTMALAALVVSVAFGAAGAIPAGARPSRANVFGSVALDYKLVLNAAACLVFAALWWPARSAKEPAGHHACH